MKSQIIVFLKKEKAIHLWQWWGGGRVEGMDEVITEMTFKATL